MSENLISELSDSTETLLTDVSQIITTDKFYILNQYYVENTNENSNNTIFSGTDNINDYIIHYQALCKEMFISILISQNDPNEIMITNIYGKCPNGWKLNIIHFGSYKVEGFTAPEICEKAKIDYEKVHLVNAKLNMIVSENLINPGGALWQYKKLPEMEQF